jgi:hypothetical protein
LIHLQDCITAAPSLGGQSGPSPAPVRAAAIAGHLLRLVESGYFERRPHADEQFTATWLTRAIAEIDGLRTVHEPNEALDRLDALIALLPELSTAGSH